MRIIILLTFLYSTTVFAQSQSELKKIDNHYNSYLKKVFQPTFNKSKHQAQPAPENLVLSKLNKAQKLLKITNKASFSVSSKDHDNKFLASVLFGVKHFATYEFVADDFEQLNESKDLTVKEFLKIKVHVIPDTSTMELIKSVEVNQFETVNQFKHKKLIKLENPIVITYFSSHIENKNGMNKISKILIRHENRIIYSSTQDGHLININHNKEMNKHIFAYKIGKLNKLASGGLMHFTLNNFLLNVKSDIHINAANLSAVSDIYKNQNKDLKRISDKGKLLVSNKHSENLIDV